MLIIAQLETEEIKIGDIGQKLVSPAIALARDLLLAFWYCPFTKIGLRALMLLRTWSFTPNTVSLTFPHELGCFVGSF